MLARKLFRGHKAAGIAANAGTGKSICRIDTRSQDSEHRPHVSDGHDQLRNDSTKRHRRW